MINNRIDDKNQSRVLSNQVMRVLKYKYRWFYILLTGMLFSLLLFIYDINPKLRMLRSLTKTKKELTTKLGLLQDIWKTHRNETSVVNNVEFELIKPIDLLTNIFVLASLQRLTIQSVHSQGILAAESKETAITLFLLGDFPSLAKFVRLLNKEMPTLILSDFRFKSHQDKIQFGMKMVINGAIKKLDYLDKKQLITSELNNPFCKEANLPLAKRNLLNSTPLSQIKMIGYLQQGERREAVLMLANNVTTAVGLGANVGKEHGVVTAIFNQGINVSLGSKQQVIRISLI